MKRGKYLCVPLRCCTVFCSYLYLHRWPLAGLGGSVHPLHGVLRDAGRLRCGAQRRAPGLHHAAEQRHHGRRKETLFTEQPRRESPRGNFLKYGLFCMWVTTGWWAFAKSIVGLFSNSLWFLKLDVHQNRICPLFFFCFQTWGQSCKASVVLEGSVLLEALICCFSILNNASQRWGRFKCYWNYKIK